MAMKTETKYYVLLGKVLSAIKTSDTLKEANVNFDFDEKNEEVIFNIAVGGKVLGYTLPLGTTKEESDMLDDIMASYNTQL